MQKSRMILFLIIGLALSGGACMSYESTGSKNSVAYDGLTREVNDEGPGAQGGQGDGTGERQERKLIKNGSLTLEAAGQDEIKNIISRAETLAKTYRAYVARKTLSSITLRVPKDEFDRAMGDLEKLGDVAHRSVNVQDVTDRYMDLEIRINNARKLLERLRGLLSQTKDVETLVKVEKEMSRVTLSLERMEGRMRRLKNQTAYGTVYLNVQKKVVKGPLGWVFYVIGQGVYKLFIWDD